jgi:protein O-GlcNAc transferase
MNSSIALFNQAVFLHRQGKLTDAEAIYKTILDNNSDDFDALHMLGIIQAQRSHYVEAEDLLRRAILVDRKIPQCLHNYANVLAKLKRFDDALNSYRAAIKLVPNVAPIQADYGNALFELGRYDEALTAYDRALSLESSFANACNGRGNALFKLKHYDEALAAFDKALVLDHNLANAWLGRGNVFAELKRHGEAIAAYDKALTLKPDLADAWLGRGNVFAILKRQGEAIAAYDKALTLKPDLANAWLGRGNVFADFRLYAEAIAAYDKAIALEPDLANAWLGRGNVFIELKLYDEALDACNKALSLEPNLIGLKGSRVLIKMHICDWKSFDTECSNLISSIRNENDTAPPFAFLGIPSSSYDQLQCAKLWVAKQFPSSDKAIWQGERYNHKRIRVAYLLMDVRLITELFEQHDRSRFKVIGVSFGVSGSSEVRKRLVAAFDEFYDVERMTDNEVAKLLHDLQVDIAVDLKGYTAGYRFGIFACRPAPIQVNYLGYPGTMGTQFLDYIIADKVVAPLEQQPFFTEKIVHLPDCYQVNDSKREIAEGTPTRQAVGLPEHGFVFFCFNNNYKITPRVFDCWMRILRQVENSVLWLLEDNATAKSNLRKEAIARGINSDRLIFAKRIPLAEHLARQRLADLFLDTLPFNAHTTASDALWAGLPVLTCLGETFAGRVCASLLNTIGLPELITTTLEAYESMAIDLALHRQKLAIIKSKLADNRLTTPLFDTKLFTKNIEAAYTELYERHKAHLTGNHIMPNS